MRKTAMAVFIPVRFCEREVDKATLTVVNENRACGELDHPEDSVVNLKNASHVVKSLWWDGNDLYGKIKVLSTPAGMILRALIDDMVTLGISSRGLGSVSESNQGTIVEEDFQLICFDIVSEPSTQGAFMMMSESKIRSSVKKNVINDLLNVIIGEE
jgi:hypothetical protein